MARYVARVRTPWPADEAFALVSDMRTFASWDPGISAVEQVAGDGAGVGAVYDVHVWALPRDITLRYETEYYEPPTNEGAGVVRLVARSTLLTSVDVITVTPVRGATEVVYDADLRLNGPLRVGDLGLRAAFQVIGARAQAGLRHALHGSAVAA